MNDADHADVTVIIPAFRAEKTIARALESVLAQTLRPQACVVVDDGSPDGTEAAARAFEGRMDGINLTVIRQENAGAGAARNRALAEARTTWVAFLDADDEWLPEKLARCMTHLADPALVLVAHDSVSVEGGCETRLDCARRFREGGDTPYVALYRRGFIDTASVVARRDAVLAADGFDTALPNAQDFDLWLAMLADPSARFLVFDEVLSRYHITPGSIMSHVERRRRCCLEIALRHAPALRRHPGNPLASLCFRTLAIHKEAISAHRAQGALGMALRALLLTPVALAATGLRYLAGGPPPPRAGMTVAAR